MDSSRTKYINQLVNAHKLSAIILPLMEAVEINKRSGSIAGLKVADLLKSVIDTGGEVYQSLLEENEQLIETGLIPDKLFLTISKSLRNSVVLYNVTSTKMMQDELKRAFSDNSGFIQRYQNRGLEKIVGGEASERELRIARQEALGYAIGAISTMLMPVWTFHITLYTSGILDEEGLTNLNLRSSRYLVAVMDKLMESLSRPQGGLSDDFQVANINLCAELIGSATHDYSGKLIKNREHLAEYLKEPEKILSEIVPPLYSSFKILNGVVGEALSDLLKE